METRLLPPTDEAIQYAAALLKQGGLVAFPTETVYGLGADARNEKAVLSIFQAKERPADNPLIVHISEREELFPLCHPNEMALKLMDAFWPGPLTLLMKKTAAVPDVTTAGLDTVAIRMPSHPVARALLKAGGCPVAAPSANRSGRPSPTKAEHVMEDMVGRIPLILDGGPCDVGLESTVVDMTGEIPLVLRPGGVTPEMLAQVIGHVEKARSILAPLEPDEVAPSPGMRHRHYAPKGMLTLVKGKPDNVISACKRLYDESIQDGKPACILALSEHLAAYGERHVQDIGSLHRPQEVAARLFDVLRSMDREEITSIFSEVVEASGLGLAIMNRLGRAASFHFFDADRE
jgi:L-threonylcarbamoyladenylate synthase